MAETAIENRICQTCGADVRPQTIFCYNCGKSVAPEIVSDLPVKEKVAEKKENGFGQNREITVEDAADKLIPIPTTVEEPKLKSAAAMRRKAKSFQPKRIEVIWEEHDNAPNGWFIFAAILLTLFAAGVLYLAMTLK